jgi:prepilin-type N-terminal cleavage/methylation domain-containing protein
MRNQRGFSLIEALIAMVLLSVDLLRIGGIKTNTNAAGRTSGVAVARSVMDDLTICAAVQWMTPC